MLVRTKFGSALHKMDCVAMSLNEQCPPLNIWALYEMLTWQIVTLQRTNASLEASLMSAVSKLCMLEHDVQRLRCVADVRQRKLYAQRGLIQLLRKRIVFLDAIMSNSFQRRVVGECQTDFSVAPGCVLLATDLVERISIGVQTDEEGRCALR